MYTYNIHTYTYVCVCWITWDVTGYPGRTPCQFPWTTVQNLLFKYLCNICNKWDGILLWWVWRSVQLSEAFLCLKEAERYFIITVEPVGNAFGVLQQCVCCAVCFVWIMRKNHFLPYKGTLLPWLRFFFPPPCVFPQLLMRMPGCNTQRRDTAKTLPRCGDFTSWPEFRRKS